MKGPVNPRCPTWVTSVNSCVLVRMSAVDRFPWFIFWYKPTYLNDETEAVEPVAPVTTEPTGLNAQSETKEPDAPVTTDLTDPQAEPET